MPAPGNTRKRPYIRLGTASGTAASIDLTAPAEGQLDTVPDGVSMADFFSLYNSGSSVALKFSFDGTSYATIVPGGSLTIDWRCKDIYLKTGSSTTTYEIVCYSGLSRRAG